MSDNIYKQRKLISNTLFLTFLALIVASAFLSDALKAPLKTHNEFIEETLVFGQKELEDITQISLTNKTGTYVFTKAEDSWLMILPKEYKKNSIFIEKLYNSLMTIKTKKQVADNAENASRFSLDKPSATLTLSNDLKTIAIDIGIMNTIDNSTYVKISEKFGIYHIEAPSRSLENITVADLIETKTLDLRPEHLKSFKITRKKVDSSSFAVERLEEALDWASDKNPNITPDQVDDFIARIALIKSNIVLTEPTAAQLAHVNKMQKNAEIEIVTKNFSDVSTSYQVSAPVKNFPALSLNDEFHLVITRTDSNAIHFIKAENLNIFDNRIGIKN